MQLIDAALRMNEESLKKCEEKIRRLWGQSATGESFEDAFYRAKLNVWLVFRMNKEFFALNDRKKAALLNLSFNGGDETLRSFGGLKEALLRAEEFETISNFLITKSAVRRGHPAEERAQNAVL
jgi:hypothetical protein